VSRTCLYCQNHVQRLRDAVEVTVSSGSRGLAPGILRSLLSLCCSNPRRGFVSPVLCDWQVLPVRLCECEPWMISHVKSVGVSNHSEIPAKIAAFFSKEATARFRVSRCWALSRIHYLLSSTACWLEARTGTSLHFFFHPP
jgi:hypothetical protein